MAPKELSREDFLLVFGPNDTYLAKAPGGILQSSLICSPEVTKMIASAKSFDYAVFEPIDTAGPSSGRAEIDQMDESNSASDVSGATIATMITSTNPGTDPYLGWTKKDLPFSHKPYTPTEKYYPGLAEFLKKYWEKHIQVTSDSHGAWFAFSSKEYGWNNLSPAVRQLVKTSNPHGRIASMALGVHGSYVAVYTTGQVQWDLKGAYDRLDGYLDKVTPGELLYVSLSPYQENRFFAAYSDASVLYEFDEGWTALEQAFLQCNELGVVLDSETVKHTSPAVMQKTPRFSTELMSKALSGAVEGLAEDAVKG